METWASEYEQFYDWTRYKNDENFVWDCLRGWAHLTSCLFLSVYLRNLITNIETCSMFDKNRITQGWLNLQDLSFITQNYSENFHKSKFNFNLRESQ